MKLNLNTHEYLISCDTINKYFLKNLYKRPRIVKVSLQINLSQFQKTANSNVLIGSYLLFRFLFLVFPSVSIKSLEFQSSMDNTNSYNINFNFFNNHEIYCFFLSLLFENLYNLKDMNFFLKKNQFSKTQKVLESRFDFFFDISGLNKVLFFYLLDSQKKVQMNTIITSKIFEAKEKNIVENISFFWKIH